MLTPSEKKELLQLSRNVLEAHVLKDNRDVMAPEMPALHEYRGAFVTLKKKSVLRGCVGYIEPIKPLWESVRDMTIAAASQDSRFSPVTAEELSEIRIAVSALTPLKKVDSLEEIEVGKHGILLRKGFSSGVLLPQVATEYGWDRDEFLKHTCYKAGIDPSQLKDADIFIFSAEVF